MILKAKQQPSSNQFRNSWKKHINGRRPRKLKRKFFHHVTLVRSLVVISFSLLLQFLYFQNGLAAKEEEFGVQIKGKKKTD